ncbi:MAG: hypothetical protein AB1752_00820 [Candidatus Zixiibacteriota bacterium]
MADTSTLRKTLARPGAGHRERTLPEPTKPSSVTLPSIVCAFLALTIGLTLLAGVLANDGQFVFSLDDPYIHLAMARNLALHGTWGVTADAFTATSSAPLYTLVLAGLFLVVGPTALWSWLLPIIAGLAIAWILAARLQAVFAYRIVALWAGVWAVIATGLPETMFTGMEHTLHALVVLLLATEVSRSKENAPNAVVIAALCLLAGGLRYESLFLLPAIAGILIGRRQIGLAMVAAISLCLPALILGLIQAGHSLSFLPTTVMLKGVIGTQLRGNYLERFLLQVDSGILIPIAIALGTGILLDVIFQRADGRNSRLPAAIMFLSASIFHMAFAINERRYVVYLVALGIWALTPWLTEWLSELRRRLPNHAPPSRSIWVAFSAALVIAMVFPFSERFLDLARLPRLGQDIHAQQQQMARFFAEQYPGERIALNDVGMVAWTGANPVFDIAGLATPEVARLFIDGRYDGNALADLARTQGVDVAAIYPGWLSRYGGVPTQWRPVGAWLLRDGLQTNVASPQVVFFATNPEAAEPLKHRLAEFAPKLPETVTFTPFM